MIDKSSKRILVIEDNDMLGDIIMKKLQAEGYTAHIEKDGKAGLEQFDIFAPDLILLDIMLPTMNGYEILEALNKKLGPGMLPPIIVISNSGQPVEIGKVLELGAKDYLVKVDFSPDEVIAKVDAQLKIGTSEGDEIFRDSKFKILVVEDDGFLRDLLSRKLTHEQHNLLIAADGEEGLELATSEHPSIILLDLLLPGMNGFEVLEKIRANEGTKDIPVIVLSNLGQESDIKRAREIGADEFLIKSNFSIDEVITKMKKLIQEKQSSEETAVDSVPTDDTATISGGSQGGPIPQ